MMDVIINGTQYVPATISRRPVEGSDRARMLAALEVRLDSDADDNLTLRHYLCRLVEGVWLEEEGFSGKRPFGNSGWKWEVYEALVNAGFLEGVVDDGHLARCDEEAADRFVAQLIGIMSESP